MSTALNVLANDNTGIATLYNELVKINNHLSKGETVTNEQYDDLFQSLNNIKDNKGGKISTNKLLEYKIGLYEHTSGLVNAVYNTCKISSNILSKDDAKKCSEAVSNFIGSSDSLLQQYAAINVAFALVGDKDTKQNLNEQFNSFINTLKNNGINTVEPEKYAAITKYFDENINSILTLDGVKKYVKFINGLADVVLSSYVYLNNSAIDAESKQAVFKYTEINYVDSVLNNVHYLNFFKEILSFTKPISDKCRKVDIETINSSSACLQSYVNVQSAATSPVTAAMNGVFYGVNKDLSNYLREHTVIIDTNKSTKVVLTLPKDYKLNNSILADVYKGDVKMTCHRATCSLTKDKTDNMIVNDQGKLIYLHKTDNSWFNNDNQEVKNTDAYIEKYFIKEVPLATEVELNDAKSTNYGDSLGGFGGIQIMLLGSIVIFLAFFN